METTHLKKICRRLQKFNFNYNQKFMKWNGKGTQLVQSGLLT